MQEGIGTTMQDLGFGATLSKKTYVLMVINKDKCLHKVQLCD